MVKGNGPTCTQKSKTKKPKSENHPWKYQRAWVGAGSLDGFAALGRGSYTIWLRL